MNDPTKKVNTEETPKDEKIQLSDDEVEKVAGGGKAGYTSGPKYRKDENKPDPKSNPKRR